VSAARGQSLTRLLAMVEALRVARRGLTAAQLLERTGGSRASTYRDLNILREVGLPIDKLPVAGEMRYMLTPDSSAQRVTTLQLAALMTGRRALSPLEGTRLVRELDELMRQAAPRPRITLRVHVPLSHAVAPAHLTIIDRALDQGKCVRIRYRGVDDTAPTWRLIEPVELRVSAQQPYVVAYDRADARYKTYKLARVSQVQLLGERAQAVADYDPKTCFEHSRGIWSGSAYDVAVQLNASVARFAAEWPLQREQTILDLPNGDVVVRARVAGLQEPLRWVLSWGRNAEALEPAELRQMVIDEMSEALGAYRRRGSSGKRGVSSVETGTV
jgi:predicted DNA-binding transcriptional regulator YafY